MRQFLEIVDDHYELTRNADREIVALEATVRYKAYGFDAKIYLRVGQLTIIFGYAHVDSRVTDGMPVRVTKINEPCRGAWFIECAHPSSRGDTLHCGPVHFFG